MVIPATATVYRMIDEIGARLVDENGDVLVADWHVQPDRTRVLRAAARASPHLRMAHRAPPGGPMADPVTRDDLLEVMDPSDRLDYAIDFAKVMDNGETLTSADWSLSSEAGSAGVEINMQSLAGTSATVWLQVAAGQQAAEAWTANGTMVVVTCLATTTAGRRRQRSIAVLIKQRDTNG